MIELFTLRQENRRDFVFVLFSFRHGTWDNEREIS